MIRPIFALALLATLALACRRSASAAYAADDREVVDGIAAVVNGDVITYSQVRGLSAPREKLLRTQFTGEELVKKIKEAREAALQGFDRSPADPSVVQEGEIRDSRSLRGRPGARHHPRRISAATATPSSKRWRRRITPWANSRRWRLEQIIVQAMREQEREAEHDRFAGEGRANITRSTSRRIHHQGAGETAHDHDSGQGR